MKRIRVCLAALLMVANIGMAFADEVIPGQVDPEESLYEDPAAKGFAPDTIPAIVYVGIGGTVEVNLEENPTTGYVWHVSAESGDLPVFLTDEYTAIYPDANTTVAQRNASGEVIVEETAAPVGASGVHRYIMRFDEQAMIDLVFQYYRDWEPDAIAETYSLTVNVVPDAEMSVVINGMEGDSEGQTEPLLLGAPVMENAGDAQVSIAIASETDTSDPPGFFSRLIQWLLNLFR